MTIKLHVGRGEQRGPLTIFPIWQETSDGPPVVLGSTDTLVAAELPSPEVGHLEVTTLAKAQRDHWSGGREHTVGAIRAPAFVRGRPALLELSADETLLASAWSRILAAAGRPDRTTYGYLACEFIGLVEHLQVRHGQESVSGQSIHALRGPVELRGLADNDRVLHASVINHEAVAA